MIPNLMKLSRRWGVLALLLVVGIGTVVWWRVTRLNALEQQFVGHWTTTDLDDSGTCTRTWQVRNDRSLHYRNQYHGVAAPGRPARNQTEEGVMSWSIREGRLLVNPNHPMPKRLKVLWMLTRWRAQNAIQGVSEIVMDGEGSNGRLSTVGPKTFTVNWWDPEKKRESPGVVYTRVVTGSLP